MSRRRELGIFYARRFLRIFPLYYFVLISGALLGIELIREQFLWHITYLSNVFMVRLGYFSPCTGQFWSLAVEEQFYLCWPALVLLIPRRWLATAFVSTIPLALVFRAGLLLLTHNTLPGFVLTPCCLDTLGIGALLALGQHRHGAKSGACDRACSLALVVGLALAATLEVMYQVDMPYTYTLRYGLYDTAAALVFVWLVNGAYRGFASWGGTLLSFKPLVYIGVISYGIYVYHMLIPEYVAIVDRWLGIPDWFPAGKGLPRFATVTGLTLICASCSWWLYERPLNNLKRYFPYPKSSA